MMVPALDGSPLVGQLGKLVQVFASTVNFGFGLVGLMTMFFCLMTLSHETVCCLLSLTGLLYIASMLVGYKTLPSFSTVVCILVAKEMCFNRLLPSNGCLCDTSVTAIFQLLGIVSYCIKLKCNGEIRKT
jgi:hypothetical protein